MSNDQVQDGSEASSFTETNEKWNHPRSNILKTLATFWSFLVMGANDSAYGVCASLPLHSDRLLTKPRSHFFPTYDTNSLYAIYV